MALTKTACPRNGRLAASLFGTLAAMAWVLPIALAEPPAVPASQPSTNPVTLKIEAITGQLESGEAAQVDSAVGIIKDMVKVRVDPHAGSAARSAARKAFSERWSDKLLTLKRYDDVELIALTILITQADQSTIAAVQKLRMRAFHAAGKEEQALGVAKSYYNACGFKETSDAVALVVTALAHARDGDTVRRFRAQQAAGAATQPAAGGPDLGPSVLASIKVDAEPFKAAIDAIDAWELKETYEKATLLLLADRAKEARELMQKAYDMATTPGDLNTTTEGVARAMRAEDGSVARANQWLTSLRDKGGDGNAKR